VRWVHEARLGTIRNAYRMLVWESEILRLLGELDLHQRTKLK